MKQNVLILVFFVYNVHVKAGETLLYRACDLSDVALVRRLLNKGVALNPPVGLFDVGPSIWCRQDSELNTILHRAVLKKYDIEIIDVILKADKSVCTIRNGSGWLPVELLLKAQGEESIFLYEENEITFRLFAALFETLPSEEIDLVIAACSSPVIAYTQAQRYSNFRILASSLQKIKTVRSINVHLVGHGYSGKTMLRKAFRRTLPTPSRIYAHVMTFFGLSKQYAEHIDIKKRTNYWLRS
jgi:hypothetical protein